MISHFRVLYGLKNETVLTGDARAASEMREESAARWPRPSTRVSNWHQGRIPLRNAQADRRDKARGGHARKQVSEVHHSI